MTRIRVIRKLRLEYGITLAELARATRVSAQYLNTLELGEYYVTDHAKKLVRLAFDRVVESKKSQMRELSAVYADNRDRLLDFVGDYLGRTYYE